MKATSAGFAIGLALGVGLSMPAAAQDIAAQDIAPQETVQSDPSALFDEALRAEAAGNFEAARVLHQQAADLGLARAHYQLGFLLLDGLGGPHDVAAGRLHLRAAADGGIALALVPYIYSYDDQRDPALTPDPFIAARALLELSRLDLGSAGDTIAFWSQPMRRQLQIYLRDAGYYRSSIDGLIGEGSLNALRSFARSSSPLPDLPGQRFARIVLTADGVQSDDRQPMAFAQIDDLIDARVAFFGAAVAPDLEGDWQVSANDTLLLEWLRDSDADGSGPSFRLSGKPQRTVFRIGMERSDVDPLDLGDCAVRAPDGEASLAVVRRCQSRVEGVSFVFTGSPAGADDRDAETSVSQPPFSERLSAIELAPPVALRLAGN